MAETQVEHNNRLPFFAAGLDQVPLNIAYRREKGSSILFIRYWACPFQTQHLPIDAYRIGSKKMFRALVFVLSITLACFVRIQAVKTGLSSDDLKLATLLQNKVKISSLLCKTQPLSFNYSEVFANLSSASASCSFEHRFAEISNTIATITEDKQFFPSLIEEMASINTTDPSLVGNLFNLSDLTSLRDKIADLRAGLQNMTLDTALEHFKSLFATLHNQIQDSFDRLKGPLSSLLQGLLQSIMLTSWFVLAVAFAAFGLPFLFGHVLISGLQGATGLVILPILEKVLLIAGLIPELVASVLMVCLITGSTPIQCARGIGRAASLLTCRFNEAISVSVSSLGQGLALVSAAAP